MKPSRFLLVCLLVLAVGVGAISVAQEKGGGRSAGYRISLNPRIRPWREYPFFDKPAWTLHKTLWRDFDNPPPWAQRGSIIYAMPMWYWKEQSFEKIGASGYNVIHLGQTGTRDDRHSRVKQAKLPLVIRLDGRFFWGRNYLELFQTFWSGASAWHNYPPNVEWYRKFPPSLLATRMRRDGELMIEYSGSLSQRRDLNVIHPVSIQMRDAFMRECLLDEQVFDLPLARPAFGLADGVWWDNPTNAVPSYDAYSAVQITREFSRRFGPSYRERFDREFAEYLKANEKNKRFQARYPTPESRQALKEKRWKEDWENQFCDPLYFYIRNHDRDVLRWWEQYWSDALAGYYAWQYRTLQEEIAPKRGLKHIFVGGNFGVDALGLYLFSWPTLDLMGPSESGPAKHAAGYKLALAASNGKPAGVLRSGRRHPEWTARAEALACLGMTPSLPQPYRDFHVINRDMYHNAGPGARIALLYHLTDGLHHDEVENIYNICDQVWAAGAPLEVITERHLAEQILAQFDVVIVPGFHLAERDIAALKAYVTGGGGLLLIGDNSGPNGKYLAGLLGGAENRTDRHARVGKGALVNLAAQLATQDQVTKALESLGGLKDCRILEPEDNMLLVNLLRRRDLGLGGIHLVNYAGRPVKDLRLRLPQWAAGKALAFISPHGTPQKLSAADGVVTVPRLDVYGVVVACDTVETRDRIMGRNRGNAFTPQPNDKWDFVVTTNSRWRGIAALAQTRPEDVPPGRKLARLRTCSQTAVRRIDADVVTKGAGKVGEAQEIALTIYKLGWPWTPKERVHADRFAFVLVHEKTGERERVPIVMEPPTQQDRENEAALQEQLARLPEKGHYDRVRQRALVEVQLPFLPAVTCVRRRSTAQWTPKKPGRYQVYLSYRFVDSTIQGRPDLRKTPIIGNLKTTWDEFFFSRPYLKPVYEEKLPCLFVDVAQVEANP